MAENIRIHNRTSALKFKVKALHMIGMTCRNVYILNKYLYSQNEKSTIMAHGRMKILSKVIYHLKKIILKM